MKFFNFVLSLFAITIFLKTIHAQVTSCYFGGSAAGVGAVTPVQTACAPPLANLGSNMCAKAVTTVAGISTTAYSCTTSLACMNSSGITMYCCGTNNCNTAKSLEINNKVLSSSFILAFATVLLF